MDDLTPRIAAELIAREGLVREAYRDTAGVWTWSVGVTDTSGHLVERYRDNPQTVERCLEIYLWLLRTRYLPAVLEAFAGHDLAENELGAALSFHWNTGAIARASWVGLVKAGSREEARAAMLEWCKPASLRSRREGEAALFFDGQWSNDGTALVYEVAKPAYTPVRPTRTPIMDALTAAFGGAATTVEDEATVAEQVTAAIDAATQAVEQAVTVPLRVSPAVAVPVAIPKGPSIAARLMGWLRSLFSQRSPA